MSFILSIADRQAPLGRHQFLLGRLKQVERLASKLLQSTYQYSLAAQTLWPLVVEYCAVDFNRQCSVNHMSGEQFSLFLYCLQRLVEIISDRRLVLEYATCKTEIAPFFPKPEVVTSSRSGSIELLNSSDRKAGSPIIHWPQGPVHV